MHGFLRLFILLVCALTHWNGAHASTVTVVYSERSTGYLDVAKAFTTELERSGLASSELAQFTAAEWLGAEGAAAPGKVIVTLGADAFRLVLTRDPRVPVLAALVPKASYERILREANRKPQAGVTALYLDQPFTRRVDLLRLILPDAKRVGVLWGPESMALQSSLNQAVQTRGLTLESSLVATPAGLFTGLKSVLDGRAEALLAVADPQVYSSATIANILLATYRAGIPMMAFSPAYVKAGALVAIYASPSQIGTQAGVMARQIVQGNPLPAPQYPVDFEIAVNDHVARSLGLNLDVKSLTEKLQNPGRRP